uniref:Uncharacterized protein n=1 Tax=Amblyomma cajennense TaxID=34607 RepID=A0A023FF30_AMBCJ
MKTLIFVLAVALLSAVLLVEAQRNRPGGGGFPGSPGGGRPGGGGFPGGGRPGGGGFPGGRKTGRWRIPRRPRRRTARRWRIPRRPRRRTARRWRIPWRPRRRTTRRWRIPWRTRRRPTVRRPRLSSWPALRSNRSPVRQSAVPRGVSMRVKRKKCRGEHKMT